MKTTQIGAILSCLRAAVSGIAQLAQGPGLNGANTTGRPTLRKLAITCLAAAMMLFPIHGVAGDSSEGSHGMVLFGGKDGLYASHLPMFHAPHDRQVILRVHFADMRLDHTMRAKLEGTNALWTLDPQRFELNRLGPASAHRLSSFATDVVEGHFEQGGLVRYQQARLYVDEVMLYRVLTGEPTSRSISAYVPVGNFLVKLVDSRPDFDHIVRLRGPVLGAVEVPKTGLDANMEALARQVSLAGTIYLSADDLR